MKLFFTLILLFCVLMSGCSSSPMKSSNAPTAYLELQPDPNALTIISSHLNLKHGDMGYITIKGRPETRYTITTSYSRAGRVYNVTQWRVTGKNGEAVFNWAVGSDTDGGTYPVTISGGGNTITTYHTVLP